MDHRREADDDGDEIKPPSESSEDEWRDSRPTESVQGEEWRRGIQPPRADEWNSSRRADSPTAHGPGAGEDWRSVRDDADSTAGSLEHDAATDIADADRAALQDITGSGHVELNRTLSQGSIEDVERVATRVNAVSRALEKLPAHEGTVMRGSGGNLTDAQIAEYEPGEIRVEDRFLHSSVDPEVADGIFHGNVVWAIESQRGREVEQHSAVPGEKEVMFDKFARFEVLAKDRIEETNQWLILMREL
jgi:hypothetical protein